MENLMVKVHNVETGEVIEREMTKAEMDQHKAEVTAYQAELQAADEKAAAKIALLERLGITAEEAALLLA